LAQMLWNRLRPSRPKNKPKQGSIWDSLRVDTYVMRAKRFDDDEDSGDKPWPTKEIPKPNFR
jgi:hypothetical protein